MNIVVNNGAAQRSRVVEIRVPAADFPHGVLLVNLATETIVTPNAEQVGSTLVLTFDGDSLPDGRYAVVPAQGHFHRLFGDFNGDGNVDLSDSGTFGNAMGTVVGQAGYDAAADYDGDGRVDAEDYSQFQQRFGQSV